MQASVKTTSFGPFVTPGDDRVLDFYERGKAAALKEAVLGAVKFHWNKISHLAATQNIGKTLPFLSSVGSLQYYVGRDEQGILRGGNPHWRYLQDVCTPFQSDEQKYKNLCRELAQLPGNVAFAFKASPDLRDAHIVRAAFLKAGFTNIPRKTYLFDGTADREDPIKKIKSDARTKVNSARRDLELTTMSVDEFFAFYNENLQIDGKKSHFFLNIDHDMIRKGKNIEIIAVRKKAADDGTTYPIEAAMLCGWDDDGFYKLMRITYRRDAEHNAGNAPHKHAIKMLAVETMKRASEKGMLLDVDGATPGGVTVYQRFGVFQEVLHDEYKRKTVQTLFVKFKKKDLLTILARLMSVALSGFIVQ